MQGITLHGTTPITQIFSVKWRHKTRNLLGYSKNYFLAAILLVFLEHYLRVIQELNLFKNIIYL
jgi:hypothetical protein